MSQGAYLMLLSVFFFSITHACVKFLAHIPFLELVVFRSLISLSLCLLGLRRMKVKGFGRRKGLLVLRGVAGTLALCAYFYTLQTMPLATAVTLQYLSPIFTLVIAGLFLKEPPKAKQWGFFILAFFGVVLVKGFDQRVDPIGLLIGLGAAIGSAVAYNFVRMLRKSEHELMIVFYFPLVAIPLVSPFAMAEWVTPRGWDWVFVLAIGVFTQLAQVNMTKAYQIEKAANVGIYNYVGLLIALLTGFFLFGEDMGILSLAGMLLIFISVFLSSRVRA